MKKYSIKETFRKNLTTRLNWECLKDGQKKEIASRLAIHPSTLSNYIRGHRGTNEDFRRAACDVFGWDYNEMCGIEPSNETPKQTAAVEMMDEQADTPHVSERQPEYSSILQLLDSHIRTIESQSGAITELLKKLEILEKEVERLKAMRKPKVPETNKDDVG